MVHLPTVKEQEEFREKNLERLLEKYNRGYVVYYNGPHNTYEHYRTETDLRQAYLYLFDSQFRASTNPLGNEDIKV